MIEKTVLDYLNNSLSVPVYLEKPTDKTEFVLIEKTGSRRDNFINRATFAIQSYAKSLYKAAELNEQVKVAMIGDGVESYGIITEDIGKCELNSDYNFTDTTTKEYRYQAVFDLIY